MNLKRRNTKNTTSQDRLKRDELVATLSNLAQTKYFFRNQESMTESIDYFLSYVMEGNQIERHYAQSHQGILTHVFREEFLFAQEGISLINDFTGRELNNLMLFFLSELIICSNFKLSYIKDEQLELIQLIENLLIETSTQTGIPKQLLLLNNRRFVNHFKFLALQILTNDFHELEPYNEIYFYIKDRYPTSFAVANKLRIFITESYNVDLSNNETSYLALHIEKCFNQHLRAN